jgi:thioredoxin reductase
MSESGALSPEYDAVIIGGGAAGLSAALTLGRSRRRTLVLDTGQPRNAASPAAHGVFSRDGTPPGELLDEARRQVARYPTVELRRIEAQRARVGPLGLTVTLADGFDVHARRLVLACGVRDELPPIEGLAERWGTRVLHCAYCHGYEVADQPIALYVRGKTAASTLEVHWQLTRDLVLCTDGPADLGEAERRYVAQRRIRVVETPLVALSGGDSQSPLVLHFADGSSETRAALFLSAPVRIASPIPEELGCEFVNPNRLVVDADGRTTVPGVYAAGDIACPTRQVAAAAASAAVAAMALNEDLAREDAGLVERVAIPVGAGAARADG